MSKRDKIGTIALHIICGVFIAYGIADKYLFSLIWGLSLICVYWLARFITKKEKNND
jgi:hypothetical protein